MEKSAVFSMCGMCSVRCPIRVETKGDDVLRIEGNPHAAGIRGALCARGAAGRSLLYDEERPQGPMIRAGARGEGKWRKVSWDEAFDYVAEKLNRVREQYGDRSLLFSDRGGPFRDTWRALLRGLGTPNYCNHDTACALNVHHAAKSLFGLGRKGFVYDLKNSKHVVLQTRNILEAINVKEVNDLLDGMAAGGKLTVIDIRASVTACKADRFMMIRPGSDYGFNLALIHELLASKLYNEEFVAAWFKDFEALQAFVQPYTPEWAEAETGIPATELRAFAAELAEAAPSVIWHPGWMNARYNQSWALSRSIYIINALLGAIGAKGGLPLGNSLADVGRKGLKTLESLYPKPKEKRVDGAGWRSAQFDGGPGLLTKAFEAIESGDPYPIKAYIAWRHDPLMAFPDPERQREILDKLDLMVAVTFSWSDTAWFSDVILPLSTYLERDSIIIEKGGLKPSLALRRRAVPPRYDTRADWEIVSGLAKRFGLDALAYERIEDLWAFQLEGTDVRIEDFDAKGWVDLAASASYKPLTEKSFKTGSGKIEIIAPAWEGQGLSSLEPYASPERPDKGRFRLAFGRVAVHTQGHTVNNPMLHECMSENTLWLHSDAAAALGVATGDLVEASAGGSSGSLKAFVTDCIHPEAAFMVHGFGHTLPVESRAFGRGVADNALMRGGLDKTDPGGGGLSLQECFVTVRKAS